MLTVNVTEKQPSFAEKEQAVMQVRNIFGCGPEKFTSVERFREEYDSDDVEQLFQEDLDDVLHFVSKGELSELHQQILQVYKNLGVLQ